MYISTETTEQTNLRLVNVLKLSVIKDYETCYYFKEIVTLENNEPIVMLPNALAIIRDETCISQLVPVTSSDSSVFLECFYIIRIHFPPDVDNSGFVGWLASLFKQRLGTGVFVICGQNSRNGGIYDYWGFPASMKTEVKALLETIQ
jgi:hypothetical protein